MTEKKNKGGLKKGQTNNPNGRRKGSKNIVSGEIKEKIAALLDSKFETFKKDFTKLASKPEVRAKLYLEMAKLIIPKPQDPEENEKNRESVNALMNKFFPKSDD